MLPLLIGLLAAVGPLLRGAWDLWAQSALVLAVTAGFSLWLIGRLAVGYIPLPSNRTLLWVLALGCLGACSAWLSPVRAQALPAWRAEFLGLWVFLAMTAVSKDERSAIDEAIRASAWVLLLLAPASFLNANVFAGTSLMLLALAAQKRDWLLAGGLVLILFWERSVGAWLGLGGALILSRRSAGGTAYRLGAAIGFVCLVAIYGKLESPEVLHRWQWWETACRMAWTRPLLGFGPGSFAYAMTAFEDPGRALSSLYAHQHFLETAAENGLPYLFLWGAGLYQCLRRGGPHKRFGALAILIQSLWDYPLSIPANFWLFSYFTASSIPESSRGVNIPARLKFPAALLVLALAAGSGVKVFNCWEADRLKSSAVEEFRRGAPAGEALSRLRRAAVLADDSETERYAAEILLAAAKPNDELALLDADRHLERAAALNPYRASTWAALERLDIRLGRPREAAEKRREGALFCPILRVIPGSPP